MTASTSSPTSAQQTPGGAPAPQPAAADHARMARISHLFRGSRQLGRIHPLEHLVQQLRSEPAAAAQETAP